MHSYHVKTKSSSLRAVMNDPNLSKTIKEAMDSPIGSSKRTRARNILRVVNRGLSRGVINMPMMGAMDGQGGALPSNTQYNQNKLKVTAPQTTGQKINVAPAAPQPTVSATGQPTVLPNTIFLKGAPASPTPIVSNEKPDTGVLGSLKNFFGSLNLKTKQYNPASTASVGSDLQRMGSELNQKVIQPVNQAVVQPAVSKVKQAVQSPAVQQFGPSASRLGSAFTGQQGLLTNVGRLGEKIPSGIGTTPTAPSTTAVSTQSATAQSGATPTPTTQYQGAIGPQTQTGTAAGVGQDLYLNDYNNLDEANRNFGSAAIDNWYNNLEVNDKAYFKDVYDAVKSGLGADWYVDYVMNSKEKMKQMFPNTPEEYLPVGASLAGQLNKLSETLDSKFKIEQQLDNLTRLATQGATLNMDLSNFIKGKDQYLGTIDKMLDDLKDTMAYSDTSNPFVAQRLNNYQNYLTTLKGRQNQRYMDFVDQSINLYNAQFQNAQNLYTKSLDEVEKKFTKAAAITEEDYNRAKDTLKNLYTMVADQETLADNRWKMQQERTKSALDNAQSVLNLKKTQKEYEQLGKKALTSNEQNILEQSIMGVVRDKDTKQITSLGNRDLLSILSQAENQGIESQPVEDFYMNAVDNDVSNSTRSTGQFSDVFSQYSPTVQALISSGRQDDAAILQAQLMSSAVKGLKDYLTNSSRITIVVDALKDLVGVGFGGEIKDRQKFIDKYKDVISEDILKELFALKEIRKADYKNVEEVFDFSKGDEDFINQLLNDLLGYWQSSLTL